MCVCPPPPHLEQDHNGLQVLKRKFWQTPTLFFNTRRKIRTYWYILITTLAPQKNKIKNIYPPTFAWLASDSQFFDEHRAHIVLKLLTSCRYNPKVNF